jgi:hypothetical protein
MVKKTILLVFILLVIASVFGIRSQLEKRLIQAVETECKPCHLSFKDFKLHFFPLEIILVGTHFTTGNPLSTHIAVHAEKAIFPLSGLSLLKKNIKFKKILVENPAVVVTEGDQKSTSKKTEDEKSNWNFEIHQIEIKNAQFTYQRTAHRSMGILKFVNVNAIINEVGSTESLRDVPVTANLTASFKNSGSVDINISSLLFSIEPQVNLFLEIKDLNLDVTNPFFIPTDGLILNGTIKKAKVSAKLLAKNVIVKTNIDYQKLNLTFRKTSDRNALTTWFTNLFSNVKPKNNRERTASIHRESDEPLVGFILRGMKDAAIKVATD